MDIIETTYYLKLSDFGKSLFMNFDKSYVEMQSHLLRPCHTTTYSTNVCRRMKKSASTLVNAEYVRNKF